jgi:hypothetical protein
MSSIEGAKNIEGGSISIETHPLRLFTYLPIADRIISNLSAMIKLLVADSYHRPSNGEAIPQKEK